MIERKNDVGKVLVFGKNGQVGSQILYLLSAQGVCCQGADIEDIDLTDIDKIREFILSANSNWVINCAAHTAVDRAQSEEQLSHALNVAAPEAMANACAELGCGFIHYSTDYVFDGTSSKPYAEDDSVNPQSVYGKTKYAGERAVLSGLPSAIIFRTAWVYSKDGSNFVNTMLRLARERSEISVVDDQTGSPTLADDLARVTVNIIHKISTGDFEHQGGVFHVTGKGEITWFEFCEAIMRISNIDDVNIVPISTADYPTPAPRPGYSVLSNQKLTDVYAEEMPQWQDSLARCLSG